MAPELSIGLCGLFLKNNKLEVKIRVINECYQLIEYLILNLIILFLIFLF